MRKQLDAKKTQGYIAKAVPRTCSNCTSFGCDRVNQNAAIMGQPMVTAYWVDANMRCAIGGFAVKKQGTCNSFEMRPLRSAVASSTTPG